VQFHLFGCRDFRFKRQRNNTRWRRLNKCYFFRCWQTSTVESILLSCLIRSNYFGAQSFASINCKGFPLFVDFTYGGWVGGKPFPEALDPLTPLPNRNLLDPPAF
jgi:hypothetical protein